MQRYRRKPFLMISIVLLIQIWDHYFILGICMKLWNYFACDGYSANICSMKSSALYFFLPQTSLKNKIHWYYSAFELEPILLWPATFYGSYNHTWFCAGAGMVIRLETTLKSTSFSHSGCTVLWNISDVGALQLGEKKQTPSNHIMKTSRSLPSMARRKQCFVATNNFNLITLPEDPYNGWQNDYGRFKPLECTGDQLCYKQSNSSD